MTPTSALATPARAAPATPTIRPRLKTVPLDRLTVSPLNVRKHGPREIASLAASIRAQGLLQPLVVRAEGDGFAVLAGGRRLKALHKIAAEDGSAEPVPVIVIGAGDDAQAIAASLAENVERLPMDELDQYAAFAALIRQGKSEDAIAASFGITPATVRRRLALARLIPDIHRLYRAGEIDAETLKLLTLAPKARQQGYVALLRDPDASPPPRWQLKAWLLGGAEIDTRHALFDEALYAGDVAGDLFGEARYFLDAEQFWRLQNAAIAALKDDLGAKGWGAVHVLGPDQRFWPHDWVEAPKKSGGHAVIEVAASGAVEVHKGLITRTEARAGSRIKAPSSEADDAPAVEPATEDDAGRPELSAPLAAHVDAIRLAAVRAALVKNPKIALRMLLAHLMGTATHLTARPETMPGLSETTAGAVAGLASTARYRETLTRNKDSLGLGADEALIVTGYAPSRTLDMFAKLLALPDSEVLTLAALVMAETLAMGSAAVDVIGAKLDVDVMTDWQPDAAFLDLVRDREVIGAMLEDVIGKRAAASYLTATGKTKKEIIAQALAGKARAKVTGWRPRWMAFPQGRYTRRRLTAAPAATA